MEPALSLRSEVGIIKMHTHTHTHTGTHIHRYIHNAVWYSRRRHGVVPVLAGSSADDQSSVAGHTESERDQTVSSPLHPSAGPQHSPTPDPFASRLSQASSRRPASAAATASRAGVDVPFFSAKAAAQRSQSTAAAITATEAPTGAAADAPDSQEDAAQVGDESAAAAEQKIGHCQSSAASGASIGGRQSSLKGFLQGQGAQKGPGLGQRPSTAPASPGMASGKTQKPMRCQKCHTCRHKQLKKQCLRNKVSCKWLHQLSAQYS